MYKRLFETLLLVLVGACSEQHLQVTQQFSTEVFEEPPPCFPLPPAVRRGSDFSTSSRELPSPF